VASADLSAGRVLADKSAVATINLALRLVSWCFIAWRERFIHRMVKAIVLINVQRGEVDETAQRLLEIDGISEVYSVTGEYDLVALLHVQQYDDLANVVTKHMQRIASITKTHTLMAFQCFSRADLQQAWDIGLG